MQDSLIGRVEALFKEDQKPPYKMRLHEQEGRAHILLWWDKEQCPKDGVSISVRGVWKTFRDRQELHVDSYELCEIGAYAHFFSYFSAVEESMFRERICIEQGAAPGYFAHPEPEHDP